MKRILSALAVLVALFASVIILPVRAEEKSFIKWVDCNVSVEMLNKVYDLDVKYHKSAVKFGFIEALAYLALKNGNRFSAADNKNLSALTKRLESDGVSIGEIYGDNKYYKYYLEAFTAVFSEFVGEYTLENESETHYGITAYFPFAKGYWFNHYDDFAASRSYGFKRLHLGHDVMGSIGTPLIAIEGGTVTELGWNRYGGWRIGVTSRDAKRYYYYAHLRKNSPYAAGIEKGGTVVAGQVIGYLGATGYSQKENVNMPNVKPHLHLGLQLIFDESQLDGNGEIWIDLFNITKFLSRNKAAVVKNEKEFNSVSLRRKA